MSWEDQQSSGYSFPRRVGCPKDIKSGRACSEASWESSGNGPMDICSGCAGRRAINPRSDARNGEVVQWVERARPLENLSGL